MPGKVRALLKSNRRRLERKFGIRHDPPHPRDRQLELAEACLDRGGEPLRAAFKASNRLAAAERQAPKGIFRRIRFASRVKRIRAKLGMIQPGGGE